MSDEIIPPLPICAVCNQPVRRIEWERAPASMGYQFTAYCHGATESAVIKWWDMERNDVLQPGHAFMKENNRLTGENANHDD